MRRRWLLIVALLVPVAGRAAALHGMAGPQQPAGASVSAAEPAQSATFKVFLRGTQIGSEQATIARTSEGWRISGTCTLGDPVVLALRRAEITYTSEWQPVSLSLEGVSQGEPLQVETTFQGTQAVNRFLENGVPAERTHSITAGTVALPNNFFAAYTAVAVRLASTAPGGEIKAYVAPQAEVGIALRSVGTQRIQTASRAFDVRQYRIAIANPGSALDAEVWAETNGRLVRLTIPSASLDVVRDDVASVAARLQTLHRAGDEEVRIPSVGFNLAATVSRPSAFARGTSGETASPRPSTDKPARLPAIVLVAGSGPVDRDEMVAGVPIFGQLAGALADAGFLVVRYDKRGVGQSGGRAEAATLQDYAEDLRAVVRYLSDRKDVDRKRIAVVGHSEGAWTALLAAAREDDIAKAVLIAAPATTGAELVLAQQRHLLERASMSNADKLAKIELQKKIQAAVLGGGSWEGVPAELRKQADTPWFASFLAFDPGKVVPRVSQPLLIIQGKLDTQVAPENASRLAELANARKKRPPTEVVLLDGVNHLLVPAATGEVEEYASLAGRLVDPRASDAIAAWLKQ